LPFVGKMFRLVAYNFLSGGSARRARQWSRILRTLAPDVVFGQECRPPEQCDGERFRPGADDAFLWRRAGSARWGTALFVRGAKLDPIHVPQFAGWVIGGEIRGRRFAGRSVRLFSVHGPAGDHGYVHTMHEVLDRLVRLRSDAHLVLGGDFNVAVGYRHACDPRKLGRPERALLDRIVGELDLISCWQAAHPNRPLAQTLRWSANPRTPYHCDGIFVPRSWQPRLESCRVVKGSVWRTLSDHNPVFAKLR
jgi:endonuclease/exonuclease/phosphatase family metal-dependent hydrolase